MAWHITGLCIQGVSEEHVKFVPKTKQIPSKSDSSVANLQDVKDYNFKVVP